MASKAVPLVGGFYADDARPWSSQDVCNWIPVLAEQPNTLSPAMYRTPPGLRPFVAVDGAGPVRGARNVEGRLLVVMGNQLYQISNTGVAIPRGTIPGVGPVQISHNQQGNSNQVMIVNGSAGYIYDTATLDVTRITDPGFPGAKSVDYLASYFLFTEPSGLFWGHSDLADGFAYNALDRYESEAKPDRLVMVKSSQLEAVAFNQTTIEFFTNTGAATGTFQSKGIVIETGCASANGIVELDNSLMWLDNKGVFQRMEGYGARPISTRALERAIAGFDWSSAIAFVWEDRGHKVAYWTFRNGFTVGYDVTTGLWHRRASYGMDRWRLSCLVNWNGKWIGGDFQTGKLYELDWDYPYDGQDPMVRRAVTGALHNDQRRMSVPSIELVFDTGGPSVEVADFPVQPVGPSISGAAPDGTVSVEYAGFAYTVTAGDAPIATIVLRSGTLPPGVTITSGGVLSTTDPTASGDYTFTLRVTDTAGLYDDHTDAIRILPAWEWVQDFGNDLRMIASDDSGHIIVAGNGISNVGELWETDTEAETYTQIAGIPSQSIYSIAWGRIGGTEYWVAGAGAAAVLTSSDRATWTSHSTANGDAVLQCVFAGDRFMRAGFNGNAEYATNPTATWLSQAVGVTSDVRVLVADPGGIAPGDPYVVCAFLSNGAIRRTTDGGVTWNSVTITDPHSGVAFQLNAGTLHNGDIFAYKATSSTNLAVYRSTDHGVTFTVTDVTMAANAYGGGAVTSTGGLVFALKASVLAPDYVQVVNFEEGLGPLTAAVLIPGLATIQGSAPIDMHDNGDGTGVAICGYTDGVGYAYRYRYSA